MSIRRENEAIAYKLIGIIGEVRDHARKLHRDGEHDHAEEWDDCLRALYQAEGCLPSTEDRP